MAQKPLLDGIRVLDLGRFIAAPYAGQLLADLGAEVVRVERPQPEPDRLRGPHLNGDSMYFVTINRHKKSAAFNLFDEAERFRLPFERVGTVADLATDPHAAARALFPNVNQPGMGPIPVARQGLNLSAHPHPDLRPAPTIGEHTVEVLQNWLGYTSEQVHELLEEAAGNVQAMR